MPTPEEIEKKLKEFFKKIHLNEETVSAVLGGLVVMTVGSLVFHYFQQQKPREQITEVAAKTTNLEIEQGEVKENIYVVKESDYLWKIAEVQYGDGNLWTEIAEENHLTGLDSITAGQALILPNLSKLRAEGLVMGENDSEQKTTEYVVQRGDNLGKIAVQFYGTKEEYRKILEANDLADPDLLEVGMKLTIPK